MSFKKFFIRLIATIVFLVSLLYALLTINMLRDDSWMQTINALGGGGWGSLSSQQEAWIELGVAMVIILASVAAFISTFRKPKIHSQNEVI